MKSGDNFEKMLPDLQKEILSLNQFSNKLNLAVHVNRNEIGTKYCRAMIKFSGLEFSVKRFHKERLNIIEVLQK